MAGLEKSVQEQHGSTRKEPRNSQRRGSNKCAHGSSTGVPRKDPGVRKTGLEQVGTRVAATMYQRRFQKLTTSEEYGESIAESRWGDGRRGKARPMAGEARRADAMPDTNEDEPTADMASLGEVMRCEAGCTKVNL
jgi:hypothetical protein